MAVAPQTVPLPTCLYYGRGRAVGDTFQVVATLRSEPGSTLSGVKPHSPTWRLYNWPGMARSYGFGSTLAESRAAARALEVASSQPSEDVIQPGNDRAADSPVHQPIERPYYHLAKTTRRT